MFGKYGHPKKKALINLPFKAKKTAKPQPQTQVSTPLKNEKPNLSSQKEVETTTVKKPTLSLKNTTNLSFSDSISIKKSTSIKEVKEDFNQNLSIKPTEPFTTNAFAKKWNQYKNLLLKEGKSSLASIFETAPLIEGNEITVTLENKALDDDFNAQKSELLDFIRKELNNYSISVNTIINKDVMIKKAYTPQEKFMKMSEKNPALINLAKAFDAEIGYPLD